MVDSQQSRTVTATTNDSGAVITITSTDPTQVAKIQSGAVITPPIAPSSTSTTTSQSGPKEGHKGPDMGDFGGGDNVAGLGAFARGPLSTLVTRTVTNLPNGVQITFSTSNSRLLARIQAQVNNYNLVTTTYAKTSNGITISKTSSDPSTVAILQAEATAPKMGMRHGMRGGHGGPKGAPQNETQSGTQG